jgi:predicted RNA-binding Zn ribbon-like protein
VAPFLGRPVGARELSALRELHDAVLAIVDALIDRGPPPIDALNRLAARSPAVQVLELDTDGALLAMVRPGRASAAATLAHRAIPELAELDPLRLRRCGRPECRLVFYDRTRSGTQRWHAELPCGLRERQRRHRVANINRAARRATTTDKTKRGQ